MVILNFIRGASANDLRRMLLLTLVAGVANALLVVVVNEVANTVAVGASPAFALWLLFAGSVLIYYQCNKIALLRANVPHSASYADNAVCQ